MEIWLYHQDGDLEYLFFANGEFRLTIGGDLVVIFPHGSFFNV